MFFIHIVAPHDFPLAGIALFLWAMIIGSVITGIHLGTGGSFADFQSGNMPNWTWSLTMVLSPSNMYQTVTMLGFNLRVADMSGFSIAIPDFISMDNCLSFSSSGFWYTLVLAITSTERGTYNSFLKKRPHYEATIIDTKNHTTGSFNRV